MKRILPLALVGTMLVVALSSDADAAADDDLQAMLVEAQKLLTQQKVDDAVVILRKVVAKAPMNDQYLAILSDQERHIGQFKDGVAHALEAIKLNPKVGAYYVLAATNAYGDQDFDKAREYVDKVLKAEPGTFDANHVNDAKFLASQLAKQTYTLHWNLDPQKGRLVGTSITIAVPKGDLPYQTATIEVKGATNFRLVKGEANDVVQLVPKGKDMIRVTTKVTVQPYAYKDKLEKAGGTIPADARTYLGNSDVVDPSSEALKKIVADLKTNNPAETVRNILTWMRKNVKYRLEKKGIGELDFKTLEEIVDRGHAECRGYTLLFTGLCRAAGVPCRPVWGLAKLPVTEAKPKGDFASHNWCEVYIAGAGWVPIDPQKVETFGLQPTDHLRFFMDERKGKNTSETLPLLNLVVMNGEKIEWE